MSQIIENIVKYMEQREPGVFGGVDVSTPENFSNWLASDIIHARKLQSTMFDSPADPIKIMLF
ncbi:hypothetical protein IJU97_03440 [bacterium]|nr:hypothetical protein [bacterium]